MEIQRNTIESDHYLQSFIECVFLLCIHVSAGVIILVLSALPHFTHLWFLQLCAATRNILTHQVWVSPEPRQASTSPAVTQLSTVVLFYASVAKLRKHKCLSRRLRRHLWHTHLTSQYRGLSLDSAPASNFLLLCLLGTRSDDPSG